MRLILIVILTCFCINFSSELEAEEKATNMISFQPLGFFLMWSNIEYEWYVNDFYNHAFTAAGRINFITPPFGLSPLRDFDKWDEFSGGLGLSARIYYSKSMVGFYGSVNIDTYRLFTWDKQNSASLELGYKFVRELKQTGFTITPAIGISYFLDGVGRGGPGPLIRIVM